MSTQPSAGQVLIGVAAVAAGAAASYYAKPDKIVDYTLNKASGLYVNLCYQQEDHAEGHPRRGFFDRSIRGVAKLVDQTALALQWKNSIDEFDQQSPVKSQTLVTAIVGLTAFAITKKVLRAAIA